MKILDGRKIAILETEKLKQNVSKMKKIPSLCIIQVGNLLESNKYINNKIKKSIELGIKVEHKKYSETISESELINEIKKNNDIFDGIIVQLPLPNHLNKQKILNTIDYKKDVDCCTDINYRKFYNDEPTYIPATARAILMILNFYNIDLNNKKILVIGESDLVGKPTKKLLSKYSNYVESTNRKKGIENSSEFDILIVAAGSPKLIKKENIKQGAIVIDVGITIINGILYGDVDWDSIKSKASAASPVPGGVGPLTIICLMKNLIENIYN